MTVTERDAAYRTTVSDATVADSAVNAPYALRAREESVAEAVDTAAETVAQNVTDGDGSSDGWRPWWAVLLGSARPPEPWRQRPAALVAMWRYARRGTWTGPDVQQVRDTGALSNHRSGVTVGHQQRPPRGNDLAPWRNVRNDDTPEDLEGLPTRTRLPVSRRAGLVWFWAVAAPVTTVCRYVAWAVTAPCRSSWSALRLPRPATYRPMSLAVLWRYARRGGWPGSGGRLRRARVWWGRMVALPTRVVTDYTIWLAARPSRAMTFALTAFATWMAAR